MPSNSEASIEISSPDSSISVSSSIRSSSSSSIQSNTTTSAESESSDSGIQADPLALVYYERIQIPPEPSLRDILIRASGTDNLAQLTEIKLHVIVSDISLQHLCIYTPHLTRLNLEGSVVTSLRDLGCGLTNLRVLRVSRCGLPSLDGLLCFQNLEEFYADHNRITNLSPCACLSNVRVIDLRRNGIRDISFVSFLGVCEHLEHLWLDENENLVQQPRYRFIIKGFLPDLRTLDGRPLDDDLETIEDQYPIASTSSQSQGQITDSNNLAAAQSHNTSSMVEYSKNKDVPFFVSFPPKILSPRSTSASSDTSDSSSSRFLGVVNAAIRTRETIRSCMGSGGTSRAKLNSNRLAGPFLQSVLKETEELCTKELQLLLMEQNSGAKHQLRNASEGLPGMVDIENCL